LAQRDPLLRHLLAHAPHRLVGSSSWDGIDGRPLGEALEFAYAHQVTIDDDLPAAVIPPDAPSHGHCVVPYDPAWEHLRASGVTVLRVLVDLRSARVAEISTNAPRGVVSPVPGKPYPSCEEATA
jgi:hypothetical protein